MKIEIREAKSIVTKSNIPSVDYVINPYVGCTHRCVYCYAEFMIRFTGHKGEKWGEFLDIKKFKKQQIKPSKYMGKTVLLSSVTDPYLPLEKKYKNTRTILEQLTGTKGKTSILTKSKLVTRDIDLFQQIDNIEVGISISTLDDEFARIIEPGASKPSERLEALKTVHEAGIKTYTFISPIFPFITDYKAIIDNSINFSDEYMFENLNFRPHNVPRIYNIIEEHHPELLIKYKELRKDHSYWEQLEKEIDEYCKKRGLTYLIEFHHGGFSKS